MMDRPKWTLLYLLYVLTEMRSRRYWIDVGYCYYYYSILLL